MISFLIYLKRALILELKKTIAYPASFWTEVLTIPLFTIAQILFIESIFSHTETFAGYTKYQAFVLFGTYNFIHASGHVFVYDRLSELKGMIRGDANESFDSALTKPLDSQLYNTLGRFNYSNLGQYIVNFAIIFYGLSNQSHIFSIYNVINYFLFILMGIITIYLTYLFASTFLFYFPELQMTEALWEEFAKIGQYPTAIYKGFTGILFNVAIPLTLMGSIPTEALFGRTSNYALLYYAIVLFILFVLTRMFWKISVNKYSSFSS